MSTMTDECIFFCVMMCVTKGELIRNITQELFMQFNLPHVMDSVDYSNQENTQVLKV